MNWFTDFINRSPAASITSATAVPQPSSLASTPPTIPEPVMSDTTAPAAPSVPAVPTAPVQSPVVNMFSAAPDMTPQAPIIFNAFAGFIAAMEIYFPKATKLQKLGNATQLAIGLFPQLKKAEQDVSATISVMAPIIKSPGGVVGGLITAALEAPEIAADVANVVGDVQGIVGAVMGAHEGG